MMQSISCWGQFQMQAPGTENFKDYLMSKLIKGGPHSSPAKLTEYTPPGASTPVKPANTDANGGYSEKLPRK